MDKVNLMYLFVIIFFFLVFSGCSSTGSKCHGFYPGECNGTCYNPDQFSCVNNEIRVKCGNSVCEKEMDCCYGNCINMKTTGCCGHQTYLHISNQGSIFEGNGSSYNRTTQSCCGTTIYDLDKYTCCNSTLYKKDSITCCSGNTVCKSYESCCCDETRSGTHISQNNCKCFDRRLSTCLHLPK
jgi:hypothetical protein